MSCSRHGAGRYSKGRSHSAKDQRKSADSPPSVPSQVTWLPNGSCSLLLGSSCAIHTVNQRDFISATSPCCTSLHGVSLCKSTAGISFAFYGSFRLRKNFLAPVGHFVWQSWGSLWNISGFQQSCLTCM